MNLGPADPNMASPTVGTQSHKLRPLVLPTPRFTHGGILSSQYYLSDVNPSLTSSQCSHSLP